MFHLTHVECDCLLLRFTSFVKGTWANDYMGCIYWLYIDYGINPPVDNPCSPNGSQWSQTYLEVLKVVNDVYRLVGRNLPRNHTIYIMSHDVLTLNSLLTRVWDRVLSHFLMKNISSFRHMTRHWKKLLTHGDLGNPCHVLLGRVEFHIPV